MGAKRLAGQGIEYKLPRGLELCIQDINHTLIPTPSGMALCLMVLILSFEEEPQQGSLAGRGRDVGRESLAPSVLTCYRRNDDDAALALLQHGQGGHGHRHVAEEVDLEELSYVPNVPVEVVEVGVTNVI